MSAVGVTHDSATVIADDPASVPYSSASNVGVQIDSAACKSLIAAGDLVLNFLLKAQKD